MTKTLMLVALGLFAAVGAAQARDTQHHLPLAEVLAMPEARGKLDGSVKFYLAGQVTPTVLERKDEDVSNRKTSSSRRDEFDCKWVALSVLIALQDKAKQLGANAVVDIVSYYKKNTFTSSTDYECHAGNWVTGVALRGTYATVQD